MRKIGESGRDAAAELMGLLHTAAAINDVLGVGRVDAIARIEAPDGSRDLAYTSKPALPDAVRQWQAYRSLRTAATSVEDELPLNQAAE
jgi:hypothetical protein